MPAPVPPPSVPVLASSSPAAVVAGRSWRRGAALVVAAGAAGPLLLSTPALASGTVPAVSSYVQWVRDDPGAGAVQVGLLRARSSSDGRAVASGYVDLFDCPDGAVPSVESGPCAYRGTRVLQGEGLRLVTGAGLRSGQLTGEVVAYAGDAYGGDVGPEVGREQVRLRFTATGAPAVAVAPCPDDPAVRCRTVSRAAGVTATSGLFAAGVLSAGALSSERPLG